MKLGLISDLHGNRVALKTVLHKLKEEHSVDEIACVGDTLGVLGWPEETAHLVKTEVDYCVLGNHDTYIHPNYPYVPEHPSQKQEHQLVTGKLTEETMEWLTQLPEQIVVDDDVVIAHARPWSDNPTGHPADEYLDMGDWIEWSANTDEMDGQCVVIGHTHIQGKLSLDKFEGQSGTIVNPGPAGAPYYDDAKYAVLDTETHDVSLHRAYYDTKEIKKRFNKLGLKTASELNKHSYP